MTEPMKIKVYTPLFYGWHRRLKGLMCHRAGYGGLVLLYVGAYWLDLIPKEAVGHCAPIIYGVFVALKSH